MRERRRPPASLSGCRQAVRPFAFAHFQICVGLEPNEASWVLDKSRPGALGPSGRVSQLLGWAGTGPRL